MFKEELLDGTYTFISVEFNDGISLISTHALVDCDATGFAFADEEFVLGYNLSLYKLTIVGTFKVIDGHTIESSIITYLTNLSVNINVQKEQILIFNTKLRHYPLVLGLT